MAVKLLIHVIVMSFVCRRTLSVKGPPRILAGFHPAEQSVDVGESVRLQCPVDADPPAIVEWEKDGEIIRYGWDRFSVKVKDYALVVKDVEMTDTGIYVCKAVNGFGSIEFQYTVTVNSPADANGSSVPLASDLDRSQMSAPRFSPVRHRQMMKEKVIRQSVGTSVRLRCRADGRPRPFVHWFKDGQPLPPTGGNFGISSSGADDDDSRMGSVLRLSSLRVDQSGKYTCSAVNDLGTANFTYTVDVIVDSAEYSSTLPEFVAPFMTNTTVKHLGTAVFHCKIRSADELFVQWLKRVDSDQINGTIPFDGERYMVLTGRQNGVIMSHGDDVYLSRLTLVNVTEEHTGLYICSATNTHGYNYRGAFLTVLPANTAVGRGGGGSSYSDTASIRPESPNPSIIIAVVVAAVFFAVLISAAVLFARRRRRQRHSNVVGKYGVSAVGTGKQCQQQRRNNNKMPPNGVALLSPSYGRGEQPVASVHQYRCQPSPAAYNGLLCYGETMVDCNGSMAVRLQMNDCHSRTDCT